MERPPYHGSLAVEDHLAASRKKTGQGEHEAPGRGWPEPVRVRHLGASQVDLRLLTVA
jgi:hypothetical protein